MENEERGPTEPKSLDPNIEEEHRQERVEHVVKSIQVVQVSSLTYDPGTEQSDEDKGNSEEKRPMESIDIDLMDQQLREKDKDVRETRSEKGNSSQIGSLHPGGVSPDENGIYQKALKCVPERILDINYVHQMNIANTLNAERNDRCDYRLVAGHLGFPPSFISTASRTSNPMMTVFENGGRLKGKELINALFQCRRFDAMQLIVDYYFSAQLRHSMSQEERRNQYQKGPAVTGSFEERLAREERFRASSDPLRQVSTDGEPGTLPETASGQPVQATSTPEEEPQQSEVDDDDWKVAPKGARQFWDRIASVKGLEYKKLKDVKKEFEKLFEDDEYKTEFPYTWKLIVHTLKLDPAGKGDQLVTPENFRQMLAFFGPPTAAEEGCIKMAGELRKKSQQTLHKKKGKVSWFAGRMDESEAKRLLDNENPGTFLVRFSTSMAEQGWFVIALKTKEQGVVQFQIEQDAGIFRVSGQQREFSRLWELVEFYEVNRLADEDEEVNEYLETVCPDLPLNAICTGYKKGKRK